MFAPNKTDPNIELAKKQARIDQLNIEYQLQQAQIRQLKQKLEQSNDKNSQQANIQAMTQQSEQQKEKITSLENLITEKTNQTTSLEQQVKQLQNQILQQNQIQEQLQSQIQTQMVAEAHIPTSIGCTQTELDLEYVTKQPEKEVDNTLALSLQQQLEAQILVNSQLQTENQTIVKQAQIKQQNLETEIKAIKQKELKQQQDDEVLIQKLDDILQQNNANQPYTLAHLDKQLTTTKAKLVLVESQGILLQNQITFLKQHIQDNSNAYSNQIQKLTQQLAESLKVNSILEESQDAVKKVQNTLLNVINTLQEQIGDKNQTIDQQNDQKVLHQVQLQQLLQLQTDITQIEHLFQLCKMK